MKRTMEVAGKELYIMDADGKDASEYFKEGFPNTKPGSNYEYFSCGFMSGLNAPRDEGKRIKTLEDGLKEVKAMVDDRNSMQTIGLMMLGPISRKLQQLLEDNNGPNS